MSTTEVAVRPSCPSHGFMELRPGATREQRWCGTWYDCPTFGCGRTVLLESDGLRAQLREQAQDAMPDIIARREHWAGVLAKTRSAKARDRAWRELGQADEALTRCWARASA